MKLPSAPSLSVILTLAALGACVHRPPADTIIIADAPAFETALRLGDIDVVRRIASDEHRDAEADLARAALANWLRRDDAAAAGLTRAAHDPALAPSLRHSAWVMLSGLRLRQTRYADAMAALDAAIPTVANADERADLEQTRAFAAALADVPPMQATVTGPGSIPLSRDLAGLNRGQVVINDGALDAIIDTGSAVSTVSASEARRLGLRLLDRSVSVGTATSASANATLGVADRVDFGGAQFRNVVFLVMPDEALTFANGAYVVHGIIGLPLLLELGRVTYTTTLGAETLHFVRTGSHPDATSNLTLDGPVAFTQARIEGSTTLARLFIDNGATTSHLNQNFVTAFPVLMANAHPASVTRTGGAGAETQDAMRLPHLVMTIGDTQAVIADVDVTNDGKTDRHGDVGLDALRTAANYVLDFDAMRFELAPTATSASATPN